MAISATWIMLRKFKEKKHYVNAQVLVFLLVHLQFFVYFFSTFMENPFKNHPIFSKRKNRISILFFGGGESIWFFNSSRPSSLFDGQIFYEDKIANSFVKKPLMNQECILKLFGMLRASSLKLEWHGARAVIFFSLIFMNMILMSIDIPGHQSPLSDYVKLLLLN